MTTCSFILSDNQRVILAHIMSSFLGCIHVHSFKCRMFDHVVTVYVVSIMFFRAMTMIQPIVILQKQLVIFYFLALLRAQHFFLIFFQGNFFLTFSFHNTFRCADYSVYRPSSVGYDDSYDPDNEMSNNDSLEESSTSSDDVWSCRF